METTLSRVLVLVGVVLTGQLLCGCVAYGGVGDGGGGFSVEFIHRDSVKSPFHDPALTAHGRMLAAARRSTERAVVLARSYGGGRGGGLAASPGSAGGDFVSEVVSRSFEYLMAVNVGTPPSRMLAIADTGSDLVWINCRNGSSDRRVASGAGAASHPVVFDPSVSSTYGLVGCESDACQALADASCDAGSHCQYLYSYGDGSRTSGLLSTETFTFDEAGAGSRQARVANVNFGCSTGTTGTFRSDGLVGLGGGAVSLVTQLGAVSVDTQLGAATSLGRRFSYCLVPYSVNASSALNFGDRANVSEPRAATTPLVASDVDAYYTVVLESVKVGGRPVAARRSRIIVDSGTTLTFLHPELLAPVVEELSRRVTLPRAQSPEKLLKLCYDVSGAADRWVRQIPDVTLVLGGGGAVTLRAENTFVVVQEGTLCMAVVAVSEQQPVSILGNIAQQNLHVGYDLDARTVTFAAADCANSS